MKKLLSLLLSLTMLAALAACGNSAGNGSSSEPPTVSSPSDAPEVSAPVETPDTSDPAEDDIPGETEDGGILIAYFSRVGNTDFPNDTDTNTTASVVASEGGLQGNTEVIARMIQSSVGGDLFLIQTEDAYPVSYDETIDVGQSEQSADTRPALASHVENLEDYDTVFLGFPNWWGDMPMAVYAFLEEYDLAGKTIVPFVTSGGSGFSRTQSTIAELEPDAAVLDGLSIGDSRVAGAQSDVENWLSGLTLN